MAQFRLYRESFAGTTARETPLPSGQIRMEDMADGSGGGTSVLAFILGALIIVVLVLGFFLYTGGHFGQPQHMAQLNVHVSGPKKP